jgi:hypothetical protein
MQQSFTGHSLHFLDDLIQPFAGMCGACRRGIDCVSQSRT